MHATVSARTSTNQEESTDAGHVGDGVVGGDDGGLPRFDGHGI